MARKVREALVKAHYLLGNTCHGDRNYKAARAHYKRTVQLAAGIAPGSQAERFAKQGLEQIEDVAKKIYLDAYGERDPEARREKLHAVLELTEPGSTCYRKAQERLAADSSEVAPSDE